MLPSLSIHRRWIFWWVLGGGEGRWWGGSKSVDDRFPAPNTHLSYPLSFAHAISPVDGGVFFRGGVDEENSEH